MDKLLRRRLVAAVGALLRHRHTNRRPFPPRKFLSVDLGLTGSAGRGFVANVVVVIAHD
jgi:hypothetical protein